MLTRIGENSGLEWTPVLRQGKWGHVGVDPKLETLKIGTNCSERRFGWQPGYSVWNFAVR
jgi:hypothetical protein